MPEEPSTNNPNESAANPRESAANAGGEAGPIRDHPCPSVAKKGKHGGPRPGGACPERAEGAVEGARHGGPRPNSGAPKGNLNALKHGRRSAQLGQLGLLLAANPRTRDTLLDIARRYEIKQQSATRIAHDWFAGLLAHARSIAEGKSSPGPFADLLKPKLG